LGFLPDTSAFADVFDAMPRYYFHVYDDDTALDDEGLDLPDLEAARREALAGARSLAAEQVIMGKLTLHHRIEVEDEARRPVLTLPFGSAFQVQD